MGRIVMFSWFKSKKSQPKQEKKPANTTKNPPNKAAGAAEDDWIYEYVLQYLSSPIWKDLIYTFVDENCYLFDHETNIDEIHKATHANFQKTIDFAITELVNETGITEDQFLATVKKGISVPAHRKIFEQLVLIEDYNIFHSMMYKRNRDLENEAMKTIEAAEKLKEQKKPLTEEDLLKQAMELSLAEEKERLKYMEEDEETLKRILELSEREHQEHLEEQKSAELRRKTLESHEEVKQPENAVGGAEDKQANTKLRPDTVFRVRSVPSTHKRDTTASNQKVENQPVQQPSESQVIQERNEEKESPVAPQKEEFEESKGKEPQTTVDTNDKNEVEKVVKPTESLEERKRRLNAQRDLILKKRKEAREMEKQLYNQQKANQGDVVSQAPKQNSPLLFDVLVS
eukprot:TRINITY_DN1827_c0_g1_i2.p1 TRINITY_DN1827_c0_g1~~TRINITY_DN1827_c0_g1_i2.p1  ORF type:complete len:414 (-),score=107.09 TRINITY_DN1827_c0_g1_i2:48-1250(-)